MKVVFLLNEYSLHNHLVSDYVRARPTDQVAIIKVPLVLKGKDRLQTASSILPKLPRRFVVTKVVEFLVVLLITVLPKLLKRGAVFRRLRLIARAHQLPYHRTTNIASDESLAFLRAQSPDLIVTLVHQILPKKVIEIPRLGVLNVHPGLLPEFRGIQPYFWELSEGFGRAGVTMHYIEDEKIDRGAIVARAGYATFPGLSVQLNYYLTSCVAAALLPLAAGLIEQGRVRAQPQNPGEGGYYRWPDAAAFERLHAHGHSLLSLRQLIGILVGTYDGFKADRVELFGGEPPPLS